MFDYVLAWLITFGLCFSVAVTHGPFKLFEILRETAKKRFGKEHWIAKGVACPICLSFWVGIPVSLSLGGSVTMWLSCLGATCAIICLSPPD